MNCKPGDLAVIVRSSAGNHGKLVEVVGPIFEGLPGHLSYPNAGHRWHVRSSKPVLGTAGYLNKNFAFPDAWLRPIHDPGDDARDQTLDWLPVPTKEGVPA